MAIESTAIRLAVKELLEGDIGSVRTMAATVMQYGVFEGQPTRAQIAKTLQTAVGDYWFDVELSRIADHPATPVSAKGNRRIVRVRIDVPIWSTLKTTAQESDRDTSMGDMPEEIEDAIQALHYPGNLTQTNAGDPTNIVSGMLLGPGGLGAPEWEITEVDWENHLLRSRISGECVVTITQAVS